MAVGGNDFDIVFAVQRLQRCQSFGYFHSTYSQYENNITVRRRFSKWRREPAIDSSPASARQVSSQGRHDSKKSQPNISSSRIRFASSFNCRFNFQYAASAESKRLRVRRPILRPMRRAHAEGDAVLPFVR
jgi:hypothetical protein